MNAKPASTSDAIKMAVELESKGRKFYMEAAAKTLNETGKRIFNMLADEEQLHLATFKRMLDRSQSYSGWRELVKDYPEKSEIPVFGDKARQSLRKAQTDELQALRLAMKQEKDAISFFGDIVMMATDEDTKNIFEFIKEQEIYHYDLLQAEYDNITKTGFWFDSAEFRMDGKF